MSMRLCYCFIFLLLLACGAKSPVANKNDKPLDAKGHQQIRPDNNQEKSIIKELQPGNIVPAKEKYF